MDQRLVGDLGSLLAVRVDIGNQQTAVSQALHQRPFAGAQLSRGQGAATVVGILATAS